MANIGFYGSHNAGVVLEDRGAWRVIEIERMIGVKNSGYQNSLFS